MTKCGDSSDREHSAIVLLSWRADPCTHSGCLAARYHSAMVDGGSWRAVLDTNAIDAFADARAFEFLVAESKAGRIDLMYTQVAIEELLAIADESRRTFLTLHLVAYARLVPTGVFVLGYSRLGFGRLSDGSEPFEAWRAFNMPNTRDALVVSTAHFERCPVVTVDRRFRGRANRNGVEAITPWEALERMGFGGGHGPRAHTPSESF